MRPPLVLEVFEQHPTIGPLAYRSDGAFMPYTLLATEKKFTDAELAAEWHRTASTEFAAMGDPNGYKPGAQQRAAIQRETLYRFATLPHIDGTE